MTHSTSPFALIVEDDALLLMHAGDILSDAGFRLLEASNGDEAVRILDVQGQGIVLLFTDIQMPGSTDGIKLAHYAAERWPNIEIVVSSGQIRPKDGELPVRATFIGKPLSADLVHDHLRSKLPDGKMPDGLRPES